MLSFQALLEKLMANKLISSYADNSTDTLVHFEAVYPDLPSKSDEEVEKLFGLSDTLSISAMNLFDSEVLSPFDSF